MSKTISITELGENFAALVDEAAERHEEVVVTKDGAAVAKVVPIEQARNDRRGPMYGTVTILGDIVEPLEPWECETS